MLAASAEAGATSRPRPARSQSSRPVHVVSLPQPAPVEERRPLPTHVVTCIECGEEEVLGYRASQSQGYLCVACEEATLAAHARRRTVLQWWPVALLVVLLCAAAGGLSWAMVQNKPPHDPVTPGEH